MSPPPRQAPYRSRSDVAPRCRTPTVGTCQEAESDPHRESDFKSRGPGSEALYHPHLGPLMPRSCLSFPFPADTKTPSTGP